MGCFLKCPDDWLCCFGSFWNFGVKLGSLPKEEEVEGRGGEGVTVQLPPPPPPPLALRHAPGIWLSLFPGKGGGDFAIWCRPACSTHPHSNWNSNRLKSREFQKRLHICPWYSALLLMRNAGKLVSGFPSLSGPSWLSNCLLASRTSGSFSRN